MLSMIIALPFFSPISAFFEKLISTVELIIATTVMLKSMRTSIMPACS
jgi:hypothetical protein